MSYSGQESVGFVSAGMYVFGQLVTAADIALESGIEEWVIREKSGLLRSAWQVLKIIVAAGVNYVWRATCGL
jgi:hypothetical protein